MNIMQMPGFTAEESLTELSNYYAMTSEVGNHGNHNRVIPQAPIILDGFCIGGGRYCCFKINGRWWCGASAQA